eukprot:3429253-Rhodomonas_salina.1
MERFWQRCIFKYLRCEPEEHYFCLVSAILPPESLSLLLFLTLTLLSSLDRPYYVSSASCSPLPPFPQPAFS